MRKPKLTLPKIIPVYSPDNLRDMYAYIGYISSGIKFKEIGWAGRLLIIAYAGKLTDQKNKKLYDYWNKRVEK